ncbi:MerC domain-containing protein [Salmonirosea aquatica]|uniref:MerC family mercury resistance protein n=1 Tax=Salmonirosea aquatica TaxID=2654236 RepID=A0A7C9F7G4_9BACT|nr:MerC family mercury resistance protein [Cytophagaceae bacterium SJW1-29]
MKTDSSVPTGHSHSKADYMGIAGSVLCLIHCLITPVLALGTSLTAHSHTIGVIDLDYFFILINGVAVYFATREHRNPLLRLFLWSAFLLFSVSLILENYFPAFRTLGYLGSGLLIAGHVYNLIYCRPWRIVNE